MGPMAGVKMDAVKQVVNSSRYYAGATLPERPKGLKPHTKAPPAVKARIVEDAPKRRP